MDIMILTVAVLATWRISSWVWMEKGAQGFREFICRWPRAARQLSCFWCVTVWAAIPCALIAWLWWYALIPLALSGAAVLLSGGGRTVWRETVES